MSKTGPERRRGAAAGWLLAGLVGAGLAAALRASVVDLSPPLQQIEAAYSLGRMTCRVYDPAQGRFMEETIPTGAPGNWTTNNGVAAWTSAGAVYACLYDPVRTNWARLQVASGATYNLRNAQGVLAWSSGDVTRLYAYDEQLAQWVGAEILSGPASNLSNTNGLAVWSSGGSVFAYAYDPARHAWVGERVDSGRTYDLSNADGVAAWSAGGVVYYRTYDVERGRWAGGVASGPAVRTLKNSCGVAAWIAGSSVCGVIYDPALGQWRGFVETGGVPVGLQIDQGTVSWVASSGTVRRGYDPARGEWGDWPTLPIARFVAAPQRTNAPARVRFVDMSAGAASWSWDFGDGRTARSRAPRHVFAELGAYTVALQAANAYGTAEFSLQVAADIEPPTGSLLINGGADLATNRLVTLSLTAQDNSGGALAMRLRNEEEPWTDWSGWRSSSGIRPAMWAGRSRRRSTWTPHRCLWRPLPSRPPTSPRTSARFAWRRAWTALSPASRSFTTKRFPTRRGRTSTSFPLPASCSSPPASPTPTSR